MVGVGGGAGEQGDVDGGFQVAWFRAVMPAAVNDATTPASLVGSSAI